MNSERKFTSGMWFVIILMFAAAASLFMPFINTDYGLSVAELFTGKRIKGTVVLSPLSIYGWLAAFSLVLPLFLMVMFNLSRIYRVKKYILNLLFSLWFLVGEFVIMIIITVPYNNATWGFGFPFGIVSAALLAVVSLVLGFMDKADTDLKISVWYRCINTIVMVVNVPSMLIGLTAIVVFHEMLLMLSMFNLIGLVAIVVATAVSCFTSINAFYGVYKYGALNYLTGILTLVGIAGFLYNAGAGGLIVAAVLAVVFSMLWGFLAVSSVRVTNR